MADLQTAIDAALAALDKREPKASASPSNVLKANVPKIGHYIKRGFTQTEIREAINEKGGTLSAAALRAALSSAKQPNGKAPPTKQSNDNVPAKALSKKKATSKGAGRNMARETTTAPEAIAFTDADIATGGVDMAEATAADPDVASAETHNDEPTFGEQ